MGSVLDSMISGGVLKGGGAGAWVDVVLDRNDNKVLEVVVILTTEG